MEKGLFFKIFYESDCLAHPRALLLLTFDLDFKDSFGQSDQPYLLRAF